MFSYWRGTSVGCPQIAKDETTTPQPWTIHRGWQGPSTNRGFASSRSTSSETSCERDLCCRGTSFIRKNILPGPYSRTIEGPNTSSGTSFESSRKTNLETSCERSRYTSSEMGCESSRNTSSGTNCERSRNRSGTSFESSRNTN